MISAREAQTICLTISFSCPGNSRHIQSRGVKTLTTSLKMNFLLLQSCLPSFRLSFGSSAKYRNVCASRPHALVLICTSHSTIRMRAQAMCQHTFEQDVQHGHHNPTNLPYLASARTQNGVATAVLRQPQRVIHLCKFSRQRSVSGEHEYIHQRKKAKW